MELLLILGAVLVPVVLSLLGELFGALLRGAFPGAARWWMAGGGRLVRLWALGIGGLVSACILLVIGVTSLSETQGAGWLILLAVVPGLIGLAAFVALAQRAAVHHGYRRSKDGTWSVGG